MQRLQKHIQDQIKSVVGIMTKVTIVPPKTLPRSEGKAKRVQDNRKL
jgi:phenylacetate-CoA ligase